MRAAVVLRVAEQALDLDVAPALREAPPVAQREAGAVEAGLDGRTGDDEVVRVGGDVASADGQPVDADGRCRRLEARRCAAPLQPRRNVPLSCNAYVADLAIT